MFIEFDTPEADSPGKKLALRDLPQKQENRVIVAECQKFFCNLKQGIKCFKLDKNAEEIKQSKGYTMD